ncbi:MAG: RloB family protein, partial [Duodenibacillus sp.]
MTKTQVPSEPILIVCEGVTELRYLTELALFMGIEGKVDIRCSDLQNPEGTVERLAKERFWAKATGMPYAREVWLVFDRDRHVGYRSAVRIAERLGMRLALTRPCIEYWFLLHFAKGNIDFEKNGRVIYSVQKHAETDESGVITETVVTRYEPVAMPDACLAALKRLAPWYSKTKISFLSYFATRTKRAYARARALGNDLCSHGSGIPEIIDRFCELAGISPEDLFESFDQAV